MIYVMNLYCGFNYPSLREKVVYNSYMCFVFRKRTELNHRNLLSCFIIAPFFCKKTRGSAVKVWGAALCFFNQGSQFESRPGQQRDSLLQDCWMVLTQSDKDNAPISPSAGHLKSFHGPDMHSEGLHNAWQRHYRCAFQTRVIHSSKTDRVAEIERQSEKRWQRERHRQRERQQAYRYGQRKREGGRGNF